MNDQGNPYPLTELKPGDEAVVSHLDGGEHFRSKLLDMGIIPGVKLRVASSWGHGPSLIEINDVKIMVGRRMLERIFVIN